MKTVGPGLVLLLFLDTVLLALLSPLQATLPALLEGPSGGVGLALLVAAPLLLAALAAMVTHLTTEGPAHRLQRPG